MTDIIYHKPPGLDGVELLRLTDPEFGFSPHMHDSYVFWYNGLGGEKVSLAGSSDILQPDSFGVVAPGEVHANHAVTEQRTLESLYVAKSVIDEVALQSMGRPTEFRSRLQQDRKARCLLSHLHAVLMRSEDAFLIRQTFVDMFSRLIERHGEGGITESVKSDPAKVKQSRSIMDESFSDAIALDWLADECGCTASHLVRLFRREVGITPHAYLMERRLSHAKNLLGGREPITEVALQAGFADQPHLTNRFRARFGLTPGAYRKQIST